MIHHLPALSILAAIGAFAALSAGPLSRPALAQEGGSPLHTRWTAEVSRVLPHPEHPRPSLVRPDWLSLNGPWYWGDATGNESAPPRVGIDRPILVPFPFESTLSGVGRHVERAWCERRFEVPADWRGRRVMLRFGAVDWQAEVWVNGSWVGEHRGGYDPFGFDITDALTAAGEQRVSVRVFDPTDAGTQPRGKQVRDPGGIWYTPVTGIWQSVWLEAVPEGGIEALDIEPDFDGRRVLVTVRAPESAADATAFVVVTRGDDAERAGFAIGRPNEPVEIDLAEGFRAWSPGDPHLYSLSAALVRGDGKRGDAVESYFGVRKVEVAPDAAGTPRIHLNGEPAFLLAPLDQGYWPDGLYTAPTEEAMVYDLEVTRRLGFNAVRKHVKVEPERWYWHCDRMGLLVIQDMPNGDRHIGPDDPDLERTPESAAQFEAELRAVVDANRHHPSIVMWVPFNEGWGQYDTARIAGWLRELDPTRLIDAVSGWALRPAGDVIDWHVYPGPGSPPEPGEGRAALLGEFGGLGLPVEGHLWQQRDNWGYRTFEDAEALLEAYEDLLMQTHLLIAEPGLSGAVYTQTTDVEGEVNGLMTYDREVVKMDVDRLFGANSALHGGPLEARPIADDARAAEIEWRYTTTDPGEGWEEPGFDDSAWETGAAGFGTEGTPGAVVRTVWDSGEIWVRREFVLPRIAIANPYLAIHHDERVRVFVNGVLAADLEGYTTGYVVRRLSADAREALVGGPVVIAAHCSQTGGGQYLDIGLVDLVAGPGREASEPTGE